tara:strand:- start:5493 stop:6608 length:1116 start_codon:yes stop_codon:yes gene_type:complete
MIPVSEPVLSSNARKYVMDCLDTGWISSGGKYLNKFEDVWAKYCNVKYGISVTNGTSALQIAVKALDLPRGSEIIMPSYTIISCAIAIIEAGCIPVLVDCDLDTWCMSVEAVEEKVTSKTRAIMPVHMFGHPVDMDPIISIAEKHGLYIIEDAAEAHGAEYKGRKVGGLGHIACFSFYANKLITTGEGGMVVTDDDKLAERLRSLRNLGFRSDRRFLHTEIGYNCRMTNIQAAIGLSQVEMIDRHVEIKRRNAAIYTGKLLDLDIPATLPIEKVWGRSVFWMYGIVLKEHVSISAPEFADLLWDQGVETRPLFLGMHQQPIFQRMGLFNDEFYPNTDLLAEKGLYLPSGLGLDEKQIMEVCSAVELVLKPF